MIQQETFFCDVRKCVFYVFISVYSMYGPCQLASRELNKREKGGTERDGERTDELLRLNVMFCCECEFCELACFLQLQNGYCELQSRKFCTARCTDESFGKEMNERGTLLWRDPFFVCVYICVCNLFYIKGTTELA